MVFFILRLFGFPTCLVPGLPSSVLLYSSAFFAVLVHSLCLPFAAEPPPPCVLAGVSPSFAVGLFCVCLAAPSSSVWPCQWSLPHFPPPYHSCTSPFSLFVHFTAAFYPPAGKSPSSIRAGLPSLRMWPPSPLHAVWFFLTRSSRLVSPALRPFCPGLHPSLLVLLSPLSSLPPPPGAAPARTLGFWASLRLPFVFACPFPWGRRMALPYIHVELLAFHTSPAFAFLYIAYPVPWTWVSGARTLLQVFAWVRTASVNLRYTCSLSRVRLWLKFGLAPFSCRPATLLRLVPPSTALLLGSPASRPRAGRAWVRLSPAIPVWLCNRPPAVTSSAGTSYGHFRFFAGFFPRGFLHSRRLFPLMCLLAQLEGAPRLQIRCATSVFARLAGCTSAGLLRILSWSSGFLHTGVLLSRLSAWLVDYAAFARPAPRLIFLHGFSHARLSALPFSRFDPRHACLFPRASSTSTRCRRLTPAATAYTLTARWYPLLPFTLAPSAGCWSLHPDMARNPFLRGSWCTGPLLLSGFFVRLLLSPLFMPQLSIVFYLGASPLGCIVPLTPAPCGSLGSPRAAVLALLVAPAFGPRSLPAPVASFRRPFLACAPLRLTAIALAYPSAP